MKIDQKIISLYTNRFYVTLMLFGAGMVCGEN